jgi:hypothetical protein
MDLTLLLFFRELMTAFDATIDTADGSPFFQQVMTPLLTRIGPDPLSGSAEEYVADLLASVYGDELDVTPPSDLRQLLVRPQSVIVEALRREISQNRSIRALGDYEKMTREELGARLTDFFVTLKNGGTVSLSVRVYFTAPQSRTFSTLTRFFTGSGLGFYPVSAQSISSAAMSFNVEGSLYYVDVDVAAEGTGSAYVVGRNDIIGVEGITGVARVANLRSAASVDDDETKEDAVARARASITQRNLSTLRGIGVTVPEDLGSFSDLKVIGAGHPLMQRDQILGPAAIAGIPGGVRGRTSPNLGAGAACHIGAHTDLYVRRGLPSVESMDIASLADVGYRVFASPRGYTQAGAGTQVWQDDYGNFVVNGVRVGDVLRVDDLERTITAVAAYTLTFSGGALDGGQFARTYEVVRRTAGSLTIPLYDLVAEVGGSPLIDTDLGPIRPVPGDENLTPLVLGGSRVASSANRASENVLMPILRVTKIELLDSLTYEPTGITFPEAELLGVRTPDGLLGGGGGTKAAGKARLYFREAISAYVTPGTTFRLGSWLYRVVNYDGDRRGYVAATGRIQNWSGSYKVTLVGAQFGDGRIIPGDRVVGTSFLSTYMVTAVAVNGGSTILTVREEAGDSWFTATTLTENLTVCPGIRAADAVVDDVYGMYFLEVEVEASVNGAGGNVSAGSTLTSASGVVADGWHLRSPSPYTSFTCRDLPYLQVSDWPEDETHLTEDTSSYALRVTYEAAPFVRDVQTYVEDDANACVGEDLLVRHFLPSYVRATLRTNAPQAAGTTALRTWLLGLVAGNDLQVSDLVDALKTAGSTYTKLPVRAVVLRANGDRTWTLDDSEDSVTTDAAHNFLPDGTYLAASAP